MLGREVHFKIAGEETTDKELFVIIPSRYVDQFEGVNFPSIDLFSKAIMYAECAYEAFCYRKPWKQEEYEECLNLALDKCEKSVPADRQSDRRLVLVSVSQSSSDCGWLIQEQGFDQGCGSDR